MRLEFWILGFFALVLFNTRFRPDKYTGRPSIPPPPPEASDELPTPPRPIDGEP